MQGVELAVSELQIQEEIRIQKNRAYRGSNKNYIGGFVQRVGTPNSCDVQNSALIFKQPSQYKKSVVLSVQ